MSSSSYAPSYEPRRTNTYAIASLATGIASWVVLPIVGALLAVIFGHLARREILARGGREDGDGLAIAGLVLGYAHFVAACLGIAIWAALVGGVLAWVGLQQ